MSKSIWIEHYDFDDLKSCETIKIEMQNYDLKIGDVLTAQSCFRDEDQMKVKVLNIINQFCNEDDVIYLKGVKCPTY